MKIRVTLAVLALAATVAALEIDDAKIVDLTYTLDASTVYWPTAEPFRLTVVHKGMTEGGYYYAANNFCSAEHGGTHMDAPVHFSESGLTADAVPLSTLVGPAVVIDVAAQATADRDYRLQTGDVEEWERIHGRIPPGAIVLMRSGWGRYWPDTGRYLGSTEPGDTAHLHFPGFSKDAVEWLLSQRLIDAIGVDTPSIDHGPSADFLVHRALGRANKPGLENLVNLERLPASGATIVALPTKIGGGSGAPARVIAILP